MTEARAAARDIRRQRARRLARRFIIWVVVPVALASMYYGCIASGQYQSEGQYRVGGEQAEVEAKNIASLVTSRDMLATLDGELAWSKHYSDGDRDFWSRMKSDATSEARYAYYLDTVEVETSAGLVTVRARAYSAEMARNIVAKIATTGEAKLRERALKPVQNRIVRARAMLAERKAALATAVANSAVIPDAPAIEGAPPPAPSAAKRQAQLELELAEKAYRDSFEALEEARRAETSLHYEWSTVSSPSSPSSPTHPRTWWKILTVLVLCTTLMVVMNTIIAGIREHGQF